MHCCNQRRHIDHRHSSFPILNIHQELFIISVMIIIIIVNHVCLFIFSNLCIGNNNNFSIYFLQHDMFRHQALITCKQLLRVLDHLSFSPMDESESCAKIDNEEIITLKINLHRKCFLKPTPSGVCSLPPNCPSPPSPLSPSMLSLNLLLRSRYPLSIKPGSAEQPTHLLQREGGATKPPLGPQDCVT